MVHSLAARDAELLENVVVGARDENTGLLDTDTLDELKVLLLRSDPGSDLGKLESERHTSLDRFAVLFRINEELALSYKTVRTSETVEHLIHSYYLIRGIRCARLCGA